MILCQVVILYVVLQHGFVFRHVVTDAYRQGETHVAVYLCLVAKSEGGHGTERVYKAVVAGDFTVQLRDIRPEWQRTLAKIAELVGCLMTCVSKVKNIFRLLRIKHEGILIALCKNGEEVLPYQLTAVLVFHLSLFLLLVISGQFISEYRQCVVKVFLLEHGIARNGDCYCEQK